MLVLLPPLDAVAFRQVAMALATVVLAPTLLSLARVVQRKMRIAKGLKPIAGPKGVPLFGMFLEIVKNISRLYDFQVQYMTLAYHFGSVCIIIY